VSFVRPQRSSSRRDQGARPREPTSPSAADRRGAAELLRFIGGRPLVGYYLDFDMAMLDRHVRRWLGIRLPNRRIEVSRSITSANTATRRPNQVDLRFSAMLADLKAPMLDQHDAYSDALMTAMAYVALSDLAARAIRIPRQPSAIFNASRSADAQPWQSMAAGLGCPTTARAAPAQREGFEMTAVRGWSPCHSWHPDWRGVRQSVEPLVLGMPSCSPGSSAGSSSARR